MGWTRLSYVADLVLKSILVTFHDSSRSRAIFSVFFSLLLSPSSDPAACIPQLIDQDSSLVEFAPRLVSYHIEAFDYDAHTGRFNQSLPGQPGRRQEVVTLPALVCGRQGFLSYVTVNGMDAMGHPHHIANHFIDATPGEHLARTKLNWLKLS